MPLQISQAVSIADWEMDFTAIRASGPGGQNVNKVSSAIHLRFDIKHSSLPDFYKERLLKLSDQRITAEGVVVIKADRYRTQELNRQDALDRLLELIKNATKVEKKRRPTKPTKGSQRRRMDSKTKRGQTKVLRNKKSFE
ncbi:alternative ribosome rescue aminoacyl-tRNA hydrolase ArfB [Pelagibaculum spongiae]|uniref:Peptidyl-tRNA hydrolase ArfB n=1 Tax=Pelagibaculum spongiae TaxID=2080658 RepID=A0A2V1H222_9GAMM|nr:alternative ribosome rescue aminoacyl-tRNA hydrolase ArfB [Pelagibaculum spongiae]PVZ70421.1 aminoacyl-tRNA hydrolase [Pelagibaculum spongiae]